MSQTRDRLAKLVGRPKKVHLTREFPGEPTHNGFVLGLGHDLVLLHQFHDFYAEGYTALRVAEIKRVRSGKHERFWETMFRGERILEHVGIPYEVPLDDFRSLLNFFHRRGQHVIIECEGRESADHDDFYIGELVAMDEETTSILHFNAMGQWDREPSVVAYDDITKIQFDTPYINIMSKYLKKPPAANGRPVA
jgi:hypothetical protein